jgi:PQQ-like domain
MLRGTNVALADLGSIHPSLNLRLPRLRSNNLGANNLPSVGRSHLRPFAPRLLLVILCLPLLFLTGCAWPMYRQGASRQGRSAIDTSSNTGTVHTCYNVGLGQNQFPYGPVLGYTSQSGGIFLGDLFGNIYSISTNCTLAWQYSTGAAAATPVGVGLDGSVYAVQSGGSLFAISSSGLLKWTFSPTGGMSNAELAIDQDGTIYGGSQCGVFYALNPNGSIKWKYAAFQKDCPGSYNPIISPAVAGAPVGGVSTIYSGVPGVLFALTSGGTPLWHTTTYTGTPSVAPNGNIYVLGPEGQSIYALNSSGALQWQVNAKVNPAGTTANFSLPAIAPDSSLYVGTAGDGLWWIDSAGNVKWQATPNGYSWFFSPSSIAGDGTVYAVSGCASSSCGSANLFAVNPNSTLKWSAILCGGESVNAFRDEPVIGFDGTIYMILDGYTSNVPTCPLETIQ